MRTLLVRCLPTALFTILALNACTAGTALPASTIRSVEPDRISSADGGVVTVQGTWFFQHPGGDGMRLEACGVSVPASIVEPIDRSVLLPPNGRITVQVGERMTAALPGEGLEPGVSDVRIVRPDGSVTVKEDAITCVAETPEPEPDPDPDPEPVPDWVAPTVTIDRIDSGGEGGAVVVVGTANDDVAIERVRLYLGSELIGSSAAADVDGAAGVSRIVFTEGGWEMEWQSQPSGSYVLRVEALDYGDNRGVAYHGVDVAPPADLEDITTFRTVGSASGGDAESDTTFADAVDNCPATGFDLPGQGLQAVGAGLQAVGAVGGLFLGPPTPATIRGGAVGAQLADVVFGTASAQALVPQTTIAATRVALLIVDDFAGTYELPPELLAGSVTPADLESFAATGTLTHGALVMHHALELLAGAGYGMQVAGINPETDEPYITAKHAMGHEVLVQAVDTEGLDTTVIPERIKRSLAYLHGFDPQTGAPVAGSPWVLHAVVNMSFAVVPCAVTSDLDMSGVESFEAYVDALMTVNGVGAADRDTVAGVVTTPLRDDPLLAYLACPYREEQSVQGGTIVQITCDGQQIFGGSPLSSLVHVAAAGNFGSSFPLFPAALDRVISVSSQDAIGAGYDTDRSGFSNGGEVMAPGAAFELAAAGGINVSYAGTSFAAPVVSVFTALDLGINVTQPLCYAGSEFEDGSGPALAHGTINDTPLHPTHSGGASAVDEFCR